MSRFAAAALILCTAVSAQQLRYVVIIGRHGVRSPTWSNERLNRYSAQPWPEWGVAPGNLTTHGREAMKQLGLWYAADFRQKRLLSGAGCADTARVHFRADKDQRTMDSAKALADAMFPNCTIEIESWHGTGKDPLFDGARQADRALATAAVSGRIGGNAQAFADVYRPQLSALERVLGTKLLPDEATAVIRGTGGSLVELAGPLRVAATLSENLSLEYEEGMSGDRLGWGRMDEAGVRQIIQLHLAYADLLRRTPYIARARASNLLSYVLRSLQQAAVGKTREAVLIIAGHDTNIENICGMLGISWVLPGYEPDDTPPGGALVLELWREAGQDLVRTYYTAQTPDQLRTAAPLTPASPPAKAVVFLPGCSTAAEGFPCEWKSFQRTVESTIDPAFTAP